MHRFRRTLAIGSLLMLVTGAAVGCASTTDSTETDATSTEALREGADGNDCAHGDGDYCGGNGVSGAKSTLYSCRGGTPSVIVRCERGCSPQRAGVNDYCVEFARWAPHVRRVAQELAGEFPGVISFFTYDSHGVTEDGRNGLAYGIDVQVAPWGLTASATQEALGDRIQKYLEANWNRLGVYYLIWWDWITFAPGGWKPYNEALYTKATTGDPDSLRHMDHLHIQVSVYPPK